MPRQQLLGHIDMDTREWADGILTHSARTVVREPQGKWDASLKGCKLITVNYQDMSQLQFVVIIGQF